MEIGYYLSSIDFAVQEKVLPMIHYIETKYPAVVFDEVYSAKTKIPTYRHNGSYVSIACRRRYITIHFGNYDAVSIVTKAYEKVRGNIGCVNIGYNVDIPYDAVYKAIDHCFEEKQNI